jgi:exopolysaccharide biosynthesis protein
MAEEAQDPAFPLADLRGNAPEGTFLAPGETPVIAQDSYRDEHIAIKITRMRDEESKSDITVADIYVSSVAYLRRGFPLGKWKSEMRSVKTIANESNAILAMTGDYSSLLGAGLVAANGEILRKTENSVRDNCLILSDGQMLTYQRREMNLSEVLDDGIWHSFLFGPALLSQGKAIEKFNSKIRGTNPRSVLGYYQPGHYCFVLVDGRSKASRGMTLAQTARFMQELGCQTAYNLDGGQSAVLWFNGEIVNNPYKGGRRLMDIVYVGMD